MRTLLFFMLLPACGASPDAIVAAATATALGVTASGISKATGGCYATCTNGMACNEITGFCESIPCGGDCTQNEFCDETLMIPKCVPRQIDLSIGREQQPGAKKNEPVEVEEEPESSE